MARAGRKRKPRGKDGEIIRAVKEVNTVTYMDGIEPAKDDRAKTPSISRLTVVERMGVKGGMLTAGNELERLWHLCRRYATCAPSINAKVSSLHRGYGHEGELTEDVIDFGVRVHLKYQEGIKAMMKPHADPRYGRSVVRSVVAACVENKPLTKDGEILCKHGLKTLADHWRY